MRFAETLAEPARCWVRWAPRAWPGPRREFLDLARGTLAGTRLRDPAALGDTDPALFDDTVYLPPVDPQADGWRRDLCGLLTDSGLPVLVQLRPGEEPLPDAVAVYDLTDLVLGSNWGELSSLPRGAAAVWPLIAGLTDDPRQWRSGLAALADARAHVTMGLVPELSSEERRRLSALGGEGTFDALFHGPAPSRLDFARAAAVSGLEPLLARPRWREPGRGGRNRELAARLAEVGELLMLLDKPEGQAQAFYSAARRIEAGTQDFQAMAREGNLGIVEWLEPEVAVEIERYVSGSGEGLLEELHEELDRPGSSLEIGP